MGDKTGSSSGSFLDQLSDIVNKQGGDFEIVNNQGGDFEEEKVSEPESTSSFLDSLLNIEREGEKTRSSFEGESIFDPLDEESIFHGLELPENPTTDLTTGSSSQDKFLNSLISLLVENTNIEEEFSDFDVDNEIAEHNGVRAVIQLREEDYPDIFGQDYSDIFDTAGNFDGLLNTIPADSASPPLTREELLVRTKTFVEEEQEAAQDDVEDTADQLAILLSDLEGDQTTIHLLSCLAFGHPLQTFFLVRIEPFQPIG